MPTQPNLTPEQFRTTLAELTKDMAPAAPPVQSLVDRLTPHRSTLLEYRKRGFSTAQLVELLRDPRIGITTSAASIRKVLGGDTKKRSRPAGPAKVVVLPAKPTATT